MNIVILGDSHVSIYKKIHMFYSLHIHHTDSEDILRNGKFLPYLMNTISKKGDSLLSHYISFLKI
jgi:hypothetical protein